MDNAHSAALRSALRAAAGDHHASGRADREQAEEANLREKIEENHSYGSRLRDPPAASCSRSGESEDSRTRVRQPVGPPVAGASVQECSPASRVRSLRSPAAPPLTRSARSCPAIPRATGRRMPPAGAPDSGSQSAKFVNPDPSRGPGEHRGFKGLRFIGSMARCRRSNSGPDLPGSRWPSTRQQGGPHLLR